MRSARQIFRKILSSSIIYVVGLVILAIFVFHSRVIFTRAITVWRENKELEEKIRTIEKKNADLAEEINYARSEGFKEREGKSRLNLKRSGEDVVVIVPATPASSSEVMREPGLWRRALAGFEGLFSNR